MYVCVIQHVEEVADIDLTIVVWNDMLVLVAVGRAPVLNSFHCAHHYTQQ